MVVKVLRGLDGESVDERSEGGGGGGDEGRATPQARVLCIGKDTTHTEASSCRLWLSLDRSASLCVLVTCV